MSVYCDSIFNLKALRKCICLPSEFFLQLL